MDFWNDVVRMKTKGPETFLETTTTERYTNRDFLVKKHDQELQQCSSKPCLFSIQKSATFDIKSSVPVALNGDNRVSIKTIKNFINQPLMGKFLLCRVICPPFKMTAVGTVVDDPEGEHCVRLSLYNFIENISYNSLNNTLPVGTVLAIKNPWFKTTADHGLTVRCDNPVDVVLLDRLTLAQTFPKLKWNGEIPSKYQRKEIAASEGCVDWKRIGNEHFVSKRYKDAVNAYTKGLEKQNISAEDQVDLLANRSASYLRLANYKLALIDAEAALAIDKFHVKCIYRKSKAFFGMTLYTDALEFLNMFPLSEMHENNRKVINDLLIEVKSLMAQSQDGDYPWMKICKSRVENSKDNFEFAEFKGPVIVKNTESKGRGLFATEMIKAGQLILASKAFAFVVDETPNEIHFNVNTSTNCISDKTRTQLVSSIAHILKENPEKCAELYSLYAGPELGYLTCGDGAQPDSFHVDMQRIDATCSYNAFGTNSLKEISAVQESVSDCAGLWITPSFINHSCVDSNSSWQQIKNFIFIRAFHDIFAGQEILISYRPPNSLISQQNLDQYNFICDCRLCERDRMDSSEIKAHRAYLLSQLENIMEKYLSNDNIFDVKMDGIEITRIMKSFIETRNDAPEMNLCLHDAVIVLSGCYYFKNKYFLETASNLTSLFNIVENIPAFSGSLQICTNIIAALIHANQITSAKSWFEILKKRATLFYGTSEVIYILLPSTVDLMRKFGFDI